MNKIFQILIVLAILVVAGCRSDSVPHPSYQLTVIQGEGSGSFEHGSVAHVKATPARAGLAFIKWNGDTEYLNDSLSAETELVMPDKAITISASFEDTTQYELTVVRGSGSGRYQGGSTVSIVLERDSIPFAHIFSHWEGDTQLLANPRVDSTTLTMPYEDVFLQATYEALPLYALTVTNGSGSGDFPIDYVATIEADAPPAGQQFIRWGGDVKYVSSFTQSQATITINGAASVEARFRSDTLPAFSYQLDARPIFQEWCVSCHFENSGYSDFAKYNEVYITRRSVREYVQSGYMPLGEKMDEEDIKVLVEWIDQGALDN